MSTRLKRPSLIKQLSLTTVLAGLLVYLGYNAISGQYGIEGRRDIKADMVALNAKSARLQAEIDAYNQRIALFDPERLDPDILSERAAELLGMVHEDDRVVLPVPAHNEP